MQFASAVCAFVVMACLWPVPAGARGTGEPLHEFDIAAQPLPAALRLFSSTAGVQIVYPYDAFAMLRSRRVKGRMTAEAALRAMIKGLPVRVTVMSARVVALSAAPPPKRDRPSARRRAKDAAVLRPPAPVDATQGAPIVVTGRRISEAGDAIGTLAPTARSAVTRAALLSAPPGISGLKMLEQLPGFNVQTDGPLGLYEFGNSVQTRAFNLDQIGFTIDGIPLGRSDVFGGSPVYRYVDNENLAVVEAAHGAGEVSVPTYASLGPVIQYRTIDPDARPGAFVSQAVGADRLRRSFVRLGTGELGPFSAYLSRTKLDSDLWRGAGTIDREHWEAKAVLALGDQASAQFKFVANDFFDYDSPFLTRADYESPAPDLGGRTGRRRGFIGFIPTLASTAPGIAFSNPGYAYHYGNAFNARRDRLYSLSAHAAPGPASEAELLVYHEDKSGFGASPDSYDNSLAIHLRQRTAGLWVAAPRGLQFGLSTLDGRRSGARGALTVEHGPHQLSVGFWAEEDHYRRTQRRYNRAGGAPDGPILAEEIVYFRRDYRSRRGVLQLHASDRIEILGGRGFVTIGVKALAFDYRQRGHGDTDSYALPDGSPGFGIQDNSISYTDLFVPMAGIVLKAGERTEIFANYAENFALPKGIDEIFAVPSPHPLAPPKPERARNIELGIRTSQPSWFASFALYSTRFENRIQALPALVPGVAGLVENYFKNVGGVAAHGFELAGTWKPASFGAIAYLNGSIAYNVARFRDDLPDGTPLAGKRIPDSAKWLISGGVTVEPAPWLVANVSAKYVSRRFANQINSASIPGFALLSAYLDIGDGFAVPPLKNARARINIDNLLDTKALSFISPSLAGEGLFRPLAPRTVQLTLAAEF